MKENISCAMNALTRRLARAKACLCYKANSQPCNFILPLILFLSFLLWTSTPEGLLKSKFEFWMQRQPLAIETENQEEIKEVTEKALVGEREPWLVETTELRLWIGRKRPIWMLTSLCICRIDFIGIAKCTSRAVSEYALLYDNCCLVML